MQRQPRHHQLLRTSPGRSFGVFLNTCLHPSNVHIISKCTRSSSTRKITDSPLLPKMLNQSVNCWSAGWISNMKEVSIWSLCLNNRVLTFKIKLNSFDSLSSVEPFHHKFPKIFEEYSEKKTSKNFIRLLNHNVTYAQPYSSRFEPFEAFRSNCTLFNCPFGLISKNFHTV